MNVRLLAALIAAMIDLTALPFRLAVTAVPAYRAHMNPRQWFMTECFLWSERYRLAIREARTVTVSMVDPELVNDIMRQRALGQIDNEAVGLLMYNAFTMRQMEFGSFDKIMALVAEFPSAPSRTIIPKATRPDDPPFDNGFINDLH